MGKKWRSVGLWGFVFVVWEWYITVIYLSLLILINKRAFYYGSESSWF